MEVACLPVAFRSIIMIWDTGPAPRALWRSPGQNGSSPHGVINETAFQKANGPGPGARVARLPRGAKADSERAQRATFNAKPSTDFPESVRNIQLGITSLKRVVRRLIPGVVQTQNSIIIQV